MKTSWIHVARGRTPRQARVGVEEGVREQHVSRQGFFGTTTMMYHRQPPSEVLRTSGSLVPGSFNTRESAVDDALSDRGSPTRLLHNDACALYVSRRNAAMPFAFRNADADMLYFVHAGTGVFATEYGPLAYRPGDFIYLPKGTTFRHMPAQADSFLVIVESRVEIGFTEHAQVGRHAPFDPTVIEIPDLVEYDWPAQDEWEVLIKHGDEFTSIWYANNPLQLDGWKGDGFPHRLNIEDIRPLTSERLHIAPSSWSVYESSAFMLVAFLPMSIVSDPQAEELPDYHRNVDTDEAIFMHQGGRWPNGTLLHLPQGITHGPGEKDRQAFEAIRTVGMPRSLVGISLDTFLRLKRTPELQAMAMAR